MIDTFFTWFYSQLDNEIFGGLAAVSVLGYVVYACRAVPGYLSKFIRLQTVTEASVRSDDAMFLVVAEWLSAQSFMSRGRKLRVITKRPNTGTRMDMLNSIDSDTERPEPRYLFVPAPGNHFFWFAGRPVLLNIDDGHSNGSPSGVRSRSHTIIETITMKTFGRSTETFAALINNALLQHKAEQRVRISTHSTYGWSSAHRKLPRPLASVITPNNVGERLLLDMRRFFSSQEWYVGRGIPWRRGYLLTGPPGTGKSSLAFALASELSIPIYSLSLGTPIEDGDFAGLLAEIPDKSMLLIEDVDTFEVSQLREKEATKNDKSTITLSGLLNALDGIVASEGRVVVMTTNHPKKLDPALTRAGRVDIHEHMNVFGPDECLRMWRLFFGDHDAYENIFLANLDRPMQPAALQEHLMIYREDSCGAAHHVKWVNSSASPIAAI